MSQLDRRSLEDRIHDFCITADFSAAVTVALKGYGREVLEFLHAEHRNEDDAKEVYSQFSEALVRGIKGFEWRCSFRTWAYVIARRASCRYRREVRIRNGHTAPLPADSSLSALVQEAFSSFNFESRRLVALRDLRAEDQELLMLRLDRGLEWKDVARVLHEGDDDIQDSELERAAARWRKRFQLLVNQLGGRLSRRHPP